MGRRTPAFFSQSPGYHRSIGALLAFGLATLSACNAKLPEPESEGARLYDARCNNCHRVYAPAAMKFELWKIKVEAMQGEMVRRGIPPLDAHEREVILSYLRRWSG